MTSHTCCIGPALLEIFYCTHFPTGGSPAQNTVFNPMTDPNMMQQQQQMHHQQMQMQMQQQMQLQATQQGQYPNMSQQAQRVQMMQQAQIQVQPQYMSTAPVPGATQNNAAALGNPAHNPALKGMSYEQFQELSRQAMSKLQQQEQEQSQVAPAPNAALHSL
jgi:hypothetical protein